MSCQRTIISAMSFTLLLVLLNTLSMRKGRPLKYTNARSTILKKGRTYTESDEKSTTA